VHRFVIVLGLIVFSVVPAAFAQNPSLSRMTPSAAIPGRTTEVVLRGSGLSDIRSFWTSLPRAMVVIVPGGSNTSERVTCRITLPADIPVGIAAFRAATTNGISNPLLFMVDDLPSVEDNGRNNSRETAQTLSLSAAVDGTALENGFRYYKFTVKSSQSITVEVAAQRLGSPLDAVIRLTDAQGRELGYSDDDPGIGADSRFGCRLPGRGEYFLEIRDMLYQGGSSYRYRLRVGDFPLLTVPFPIGAPAGVAAQLFPGGRGLDKPKPILFTPPPDRSAAYASAKNPRGQASGFFQVIASHLPETMEIEPNDTTNTATRFSVPGAINGRFEKPRDRDFFQFEARKGQRLVFNAKTRSIGAPGEVYFVLQRMDGSRIAENKLEDAGEGSITNTFNEAGPYLLMVEEINRRGGPDHGYRIQVESFQGFDLGVDGDSATAPEGGAAPIKITALRRDYKGPITLELDGNAHGCRLENTVIEEGKTNATVNLHLPDSLKSGGVVAIRMIGRAESEGREMIESVSTEPALRKAFPQMPFPPLTLEGLIVVGATPPGTKPSEPPPPAADTGKKKKK
jgi:hypothetical protein